MEDPRVLVRHTRIWFERVTTCATLLLAESCFFILSLKSFATCAFLMPLAEPSTKAIASPCRSTLQGLGIDAEQHFGICDLQHWRRTITDLPAPLAPMIHVKFSRPQISIDSA